MKKILEIKSKIEKISIEDSSLTFEREMKILQVELQEELRNVNDKESFKQFYKKLNDNELYLVSKRRSNVEAFSFTFSEYNDNVINFLYDDTKSRGKCRFENLYKYLDVRY